jgi:aconitase A
MMHKTFWLSPILAAALAIPGAHADDKNKLKELDKNRREAVEDADKQQRKADKELREAVHESDKHRWNNDGDVREEWKEYLKAQHKAKEWSKATKKERKEFEEYLKHHK